jgi:hypothetical protein
MSRSYALAKNFYSPGKCCMICPREGIVRPLSAPLCVLIVMMVCATRVQGSVVALSFTKLTGLTGGAISETAVYSADLSSVGLSAILSLTIADNSAGSGGSPGQFSGFDLDAIKLSNTNFATAAGAAGGVGLPGFDFSPASTFLTPGSQRAPTDPKLFGTDAAGTHVNDAAATLGTFDGNSDVLAPFGWISLGDNGTISFNLNAPISTTGLWLYIGEVGNNGEVAAGDITVSDAATAPTPLPSSVWGGLVLLASVGIARFRKGTARPANATV